MAQKSNPIILRLLKTNRCFDSCWFNSSNYVYLLMRDFKIRNYINGILKTVNASSARFLIQNLHNKQKINVFFCDLEKTKNRINKTLKQASVSNPIKKRRLNVHRNLLYRNDKVRRSQFVNPILGTKKLCVVHNLQSKKLPGSQFAVNDLLRLQKQRQNVNAFFAHDKIFFFLNQHLNTYTLVPNHKVYLKMNIISHEKNICPAANKSVLNNRIKQSITIEKLQLMSLRYFIIKYYTLNSNGFTHTKLNSSLYCSLYNFLSTAEKKEKLLRYENPDTHSESRIEKFSKKLYIKYCLKTQLNFICNQLYEIFPIIKHFILQKHKKKILFSFLKHQRIHDITKKLFYAENMKLQSKTIVDNLNYSVPLNSKKYIVAPNTDGNTELYGTKKYTHKPVLYCNLTESVFKKTSFFLPFRTIYFIDDNKNTNKHSKFFTFTKNLNFLYKTHMHLPLTYNLKNTNVKEKNQFCNKLILNSNETVNVFMNKTKLPFLFSRTKHLYSQIVKNNNRNFISTCHATIYISYYVIAACTNKQYLYTTYNNYCNMCVFNSILKRKSAFVIQSKTPQGYIHTHGSYEQKTQRKKQIHSAYKNDKNTDKQYKLLIPNTVYKRHIECVIHKNFLSPNPVNLHFFISTNIFQNATYLMDIFVYYLEKKTPFFKLKNIVLKQLTELKPLIVKGILVQCSGRVAMKSKKAQKARIQTFKYGETGLHVFNSKLDFKSANAFTSFGTIGIKIWICYF